MLAIITVCDPLVSIALAALLLHETFNHTPGALAAEALALLVMVAGVVLLAHRAPMVTRQLEARANTEAREGGQGE